MSWLVPAPQEQSEEYILGKGSIMKTICTYLSVVLAVSFLTVEAQARGFSGGKSAGSSSRSVSNSHSTGTLSNKNFATVQNFHQANTLSNLGQVSKLNTTGGKNFSNKLELSKGLGKDLNKSFTKSNFSPDLKKKWFPGKWWGWGFGWGYGFGWGGWCGYDGYCGCYSPWYYTPCYNVCCEYYAPACGGDYAMAPDVGPLPTPTTKTVRIENPAETQTALGFAVNGQAYTLQPGETKDVDLADSAVIEFDRGSGNDTARYTLTDGTYRFGSTPQGWELFHSSSTPSLTPSPPTDCWPSAEQGTALSRSRTTRLLFIS